MTIRIEVPIKLPSVANGSFKTQHWAVKAKRVKAQRQATRLCLRAKNVELELRWASPNPLLPVPGAIVTLTRVSPRRLDSDNLAYAFKAVRDEVAAYFGVNDNDPRIEWRYAQAKGKAGVVIEFEVRAC